MIRGILDSGIKIVTTDLKVWYDAAQLRSYPGSGTTWTDISGNNTNGTLTNGPTFSSNNGGYIVFDGTNDYVNLSNVSGASFTLQLWLNTTQTGANAGGQAYDGNGIVWSDVPGGGNDFVMALNGAKCTWFTGNPDSTITSTTSINTGAWFMITALKNGANSTKELYINTTSEVTGTSNANALTANANIRIGGNTLDNRYFAGNIPIFLLYNKVLSSTEITQNYNAIKSRFGL